MKATNYFSINQTLLMHSFLSVLCILALAICLGFFFSYIRKFAASHNPFGAVLINYLTFVGVFHHELSHALFAYLTFAKVTEIKKSLIEKILNKIDNVIINGGDNALPYVLNMSFPGVKSEVLLHSLESAGIMVSSGSACSSNHPSPSHVLKAMGLKNELIDSSLRFSFSAYNTVEETEVAADALLKQVTILRKVMR